MAQLLNSNDAGKNNEDLTLPLIIKADVEGSLEAISDMLATCPSDQCRVQIAFSGVGPVTPAEVELAAAIGGGYMFLYRKLLHTYYGLVAYTSIHFSGNFCV